LRPRLPAVGCGGYGTVTGDRHHRPPRECAAGSRAPPCGAIVLLFGDGRQGTGCLTAESAEPTPLRAAVPRSYEGQGTQRGFCEGLGGRLLDVGHQRERTTDSRKRIAGRREGGHPFECLRVNKGRPYNSRRRAAVLRRIGRTASAPTIPRRRSGQAPRPFEYPQGRLCFPRWAPPARRTMTKGLLRCAQDSLRSAPLRVTVSARPARRGFTAGGGCAT